MFRDILKDESLSTEDSYKYFEKNYKRFKPLKKLTVFCNGENFLVTPYKVEGIYVHMVLENWNGNEMHLNNLNCGYVGSGPIKTVQLLKKLGMRENLAEKLKICEGIQIGFTPEGEINENEIATGVFFGKSIQHREYKFDINDCSYIDVSRKKIYTLNPQITNSNGIINALDIMGPKQIEYYIGKHSPLENYFRFYDDFIGFRGGKFKYNHRKIKGANQVNLIIRGELFDIVCLIKSSDLIAFLDVIHLYLFKEKLEIKKKFNIMAAVKNYLSRIVYEEEPGIHEVIKFEIDNNEIRKFKFSL